MSREAAKKGVVMKKDFYAEIVETSDWKEFEPSGVLDIGGVTATYYTNKSKDKFYWLIDGGSEEVIVI